jgi:hypothetical protein
MHMCIYTHSITDFLLILTIERYYKMVKNIDLAVRDKGNHLLVLPITIL